MYLTWIFHDGFSRSIFLNRAVLKIIQIDWTTQIPQMHIPFETINITLLGILYAEIKAFSAFTTKPTNCINWINHLVFFIKISFQDIKRHDQGVYRCRVDFRTSQTQSFRYNLTIISEYTNYNIRFSLLIRNVSKISTGKKKK